MSTIAAIIPTIPGREDLLKRLLDSLPKHINKIVVHRNDIPLSEKRNVGAAKAKCKKYLLFIDDDNYLKPGAIEELEKRMNNDIGIMGITACYDNDPGRVADGGSKRNYVSGFMKGLFTNTAIENLPLEPYEVDEVANAFIIRKTLFRKIGGFDAVNFPIDLDEADLCKRVKDYGKKIMMCPTAQCCHKSITYSWIPDFRRPMNAYFMGRNRILYQKKHLTWAGLIVHFSFWLPVFVGFYAASMIYRKKYNMIPHFLKGVFDGLLGRRKNQYF